MASCTRKAASSTTWAHRPCAALTLLLALAGCVSSAKPTRLEDGTHGLRVTCNYELQNCVRKARRMCHGKYREVHRGDRSIAYAPSIPKPLPDQPASAANATRNVYRGVLYVRCVD